MFSLFYRAGHIKAGINCTALAIGCIQTLNTLGFFNTKHLLACLHFVMCLAGCDNVARAVASKNARIAQLFPKLIITLHGRQPVQCIEHLPIITSFTTYQCPSSTLLAGTSAGFHLYNNNYCL